MNKIVLGVIFILIFLVVYRVGLALTSAEKKKRRRIMNIADNDEAFAPTSDTFDYEKSASASMMDTLVSPVKNVSKHSEIVRRKLQAAGYTSPNAVSYYLFFSTFGWVFGLVVGGMLVKLGMAKQGMVADVYYFLALLLAVGLTFGAKLQVDSARTKRHLVLTRSFPDALDLLLICVESGLALDAALARVCRELKHVHPLITEELNRTRLELTLLNDRTKALNNLADRTDLMAFKSLVAALIQSEKFGTSLVETLRVLSDDYRQTRMMLAEEKAAKLDPKITAVTIPFMLIALLILIMTPAALEFGKRYPSATQSK